MIEISFFKGNRIILLPIIIFVLGTSIILIGGSFAMDYYFPTPQTYEEIMNEQFRKTIKKTWECELIKNSLEHYYTLETWEIGIILGVYYNKC